MSTTGETLEFWIAKGRLVPRPDQELAECRTELAALDKYGFVKVAVDETGATVSWHSFGANWASLYFAKEWIGTFKGPYTLKFYFSGWFTEVHADPAVARSRIDELIAKSDLHLSSRVYVQSFDLTDRRLPDSLRRVLETGVPDAERSIDCSIDEASGRVKVERIGSSSAIAKLWGMSPVSSPCLSGTSYDKAVSAAYLDVLKTGRPHYDHIYAAMTGPDGEVSWIPYQRIVTPGPQRRGKQRLVTVVSEITPVEIAVV
jgi:hypothetical protein